VEYNRTHNVGGLSFKLHDAGHILGSASVELFSKKISLVYTADIKFENTRLHNGAFRDFHDVDVLITESTYGGTEHPERKELEKDFVAACTEVCDDNGNVLVPSFAVGRAQEIACVLKRYNFEYPVYLDGMAKDASEIMLEFPNYLRDFKEFYHAMDETIKVKPKMRKTVLDEPSVIISTAGFLQAGPAVGYMSEMLSLPNQAVFFVGFQPEKMPGKKLLETGKFWSEGCKFNCENFRIKYFDFSAHAGASELKKFAEKLNPKIVFVIHGEENPAESLASYIKKNIGCHVLVPKLGERFNLEKYL
jgi:putative mRNA 3-end processing factor